MDVQELKNNFEVIDGEKPKEKKEELLKFFQSELKDVKYQSRNEVFWGFIKWMSLHFLMKLDF